MGSYDYIVVGAGSAGAVAAGRLSEDPTRRVLLVEAGGSGKDMKVQVPPAFSQQFKTDLGWEFHTEPEPHLDGRSIYHPRGRMLGGSSGMNAMIYMRGNRADFDSWAKAGADGWSYDEVLPLFRRSERNSRGAGLYHGDDGPLYIEDRRQPNPITRRIVDAMIECGLPRNDDFNGADQLGAGLNQVTQHRGRRWTTADGYLVPARKRPNLTILTVARVLRVRIADGRAVGIDTVQDGHRESHRAEREVVLSAGALNTPQLLMLSGIGPADHLREHGITPIVDNPHVGAHLMDHPMMLLNFETTTRGTLAESQKPVQLANYLTRRRGLLTSNVGEASGFVHVRPGDDAPAMQFLVAPGFFFNHGLTHHTRPAWSIGCSLVGSLSEGRVRLRNADPAVPIAATFNYFTAPEDMDAMVTAFDMVNEFAAAGPLRGITTRRLTPGEPAVTRAEKEAAIRREVEHTYHPSCTARIGDEEDGVVDPQLRVHGLAGLRVADASVFPTITHGNTHAPTVMVGEKAAELIGAEG